MNANDAKVQRVMRLVVTGLRGGQWVPLDHHGEGTKGRLIRRRTTTRPSLGPCVLWRDSVSLAPP